MRSRVYLDNTRIFSNTINMNKKRERQVLSVFAHLNSVPNISKREAFLFVPYMLRSQKKKIINNFRKNICFSEKNFNFRSMPHYHLPTKQRRHELLHGLQAITRITKSAKLLTLFDLHLFINFHQYFFSRFFTLNRSALLLTQKIITTAGKRLASPRPAIAKDIT